MDPIVEGVSNVVVFQIVYFVMLVTGVVLVLISRRLSIAEKVIWVLLFVFLNFFALILLSFRQNGSEVHRSQRRRLDLDRRRGER
ncbi:hypothetical protein FUAX_06540 [Fulvitalea axinellae]|uniref:Uncharacterized protein n=1 Tax=Fulvitalea axinellae TaxID=1182444 RepID=A0AAU9CMW7_9BACT|nr:hypothetical protein FUAX_06540 [Fulvitalea axinellae]